MEEWDDSFHEKVVIWCLILYVFVIFRFEFHTSYLLQILFAVILDSDFDNGPRQDKSAQECDDSSDEDYVPPIDIKFSCG